MDKRNEILAKNLLHYSLDLKAGEKVLIEGRGFYCGELVKLLVKEAYKLKALPFVVMDPPDIKRTLLMGYTKEHLELLSRLDQERMALMDAYIGISAGKNSSELSDISSEQNELYSKYYVKEVHLETRLKKKWVVLAYPTPSMAQAANQSTEAFEEFYYNVCNLDYSKMDKAMDPLKALMEKTDKVTLKGPGTDLSFSIKNIPVVKCAGTCNIPDGEIYTAPVKNSVNGRISFNTPSTENGFKFENVSLEFKDGKIIKESANDQDRITKLLDTDEGARYIGEFAIGVNPYIEKPMNNILFDEKIKGSIHFTPGNSYEDADNTNRSSIHWDLVLIQQEEFGGGEIYFDDVLIRKNGYFVLPELACLNPEELI